MRAPRALPRLPLWVKLAAFAAAGVVLMHAAHVALGTRMAARGLADEQAVLGLNVARLVAEEAADHIIVNDLVTLHELVANAMIMKGEKERTTDLRGEPLPSAEAKEEKA